eukprot:1736149-Pleurochrysis_carterae.AAC.1
MSVRPNARSVTCTGISSNSMTLTTPPSVPVRVRLVSGTTTNTLDPADRVRTATSATDRDRWMNTSSPMES